MTRSESIKRCEYEAEECRQAGNNPNLTPAQQLGAIQGEVDWLVARRIAVEDQIPPQGESHECDEQASAAFVEKF